MFSSGPGQEKNTEKDLLSDPRYQTYVKDFYHLIVLETSPLHSLSVERQHTATSMNYFKTDQSSFFSPVGEANNAGDGEVKV